MHDASPQDEATKQPLNPHAKGFRHGCFAGCLFMIGGWIAVTFTIGLITVARLEDTNDQEAAQRMGEAFGAQYGLPLLALLSLCAVGVFYIFYRQAMNKN